VGAAVFKARWFFLCSVGLALIINPGHAQETRFSLGNFGFTFAPKILKEGSITDLGFNLKYTDRLSGAVNFRYTAISENTELLDAADSLNAVTEHIFEIFFLPLRYSLLATESRTFYLGGGAYYEYDNLAEKGFFNMPVLENLNKEPVNAYTNDFSMHLFGPLVEGGFEYTGKWFAMELAGGVVPVFLLNSSQKMTMGSPA
jgi:hypothetical protein